MDVRFTDHAILQMTERNLTQSEVESAVIHPDKIIRQLPRRYRAIKQIAKKNKRYLLIVICEPIENTVNVVTAFLATKFKKYL